MATTRPRPRRCPGCHGPGVYGRGAVGGSGDANCTERAVQLADRLRRASRAGSCTCTRRAPCTWPRTTNCTERAVHLDDPAPPPTRTSPCTCPERAVHLHASRRALARFTPCTWHPAPRLRPVRSYGIDVVAIVLFAALGRRNHDEGTAVTGVLVVAWPFVAGWTIAWFATRLRPAAGVRGAARSAPWRSRSRSPWCCASPPAAASHPRSSSSRSCSSGWCWSGGGGWWRWSPRAGARARPLYGMSSSLPPARRSTIRACASLTSSSGSSVVATAAAAPAASSSSTCADFDGQLGRVRAEPAVAEDARRSCGRSRPTRC